MPIHVLTIVGARPQFIKAAAVSRAVAKHNVESQSTSHIEETLVHTGQHYDINMSDVFFERLGIPEPAHHLAVGSGLHGEQTGEMMKRLEPVMVDRQPDVVVVYGDTNSTTAGALVAAKLNIPIAHVEAGLRSFNRQMPEEINRVVTDHLSTILFAPTDTAVRHLRTEGLVSGVHHVGDVMLDIFLETLRSVDGEPSLGAKWGYAPGAFGLMTLHRPSNTSEPERFADILDAAKTLSTDTPLIWPVHPRLKSNLDGVELPKGVHLTEPCGYQEMVALLRDAAFVLTDSGGLQKEAFWAATPCVTLRQETEWVETVEAGWNLLAGGSLTGLAESISALTAKLEGTRPQSTRFGDGTAATRITSILASSYSDL